MYSVKPYFKEFLISVELANDIRDMEGVKTLEKYVELCTNPFVTKTCVVEDKGSLRLHFTMFFEYTTTDDFTKNIRGDVFYLNSWILDKLGDIENSTRHCKIMIGDNVYLIKYEKFKIEYIDLDLGIHYNSKDLEADSVYYGKSIAQYRLIHLSRHTLYSSFMEIGKIVDPIFDIFINGEPIPEYPNRGKEHLIHTEINSTVIRFYLAYIYELENRTTDIQALLEASIFAPIPKLVKTHSYEDYEPYMIAAYIESILVLYKNKIEKIESEEIDHCKIIDECRSETDILIARNLTPNSIKNTRPLLDSIKYTFGPDCNIITDDIIEKIIKILRKNACEYSKIPSHRIDKSGIGRVANHILFNLCRLITSIEFTDNNRTRYSRYW